MSILETARGLAIATSFASAGALLTASYGVLPTIAKLGDNDNVSAKSQARLFSDAYNLAKTRAAPLEVLATLTYAYLAFDARRASTSTSTWKLYAAAALAMSAAVPWTLSMMETDCQKIISLSKVDHAKDTEPKLEHGQLTVPVPSGPAITPIEEFEPFEDAPFSGAEYEKLKVTQLLQSLATKNLVRVFTSTLAGAFALSAITTRVTLVTIVQGR